MNQVVANRLNSITFWYPILQDIERRLAVPVGRVELENGHLVSREPKPSPYLLRTPQTAIVRYSGGSEIMHLLDGDLPTGWPAFIDSIDQAVEEVGGYPVFIRTESTSDKHGWKQTCYLESKDQITNHVGALIELCAMADLDCSFFAIRRLIPTTPIATAFHGEMPIAVERRLFIEAGKVVCNHPYWPSEAFVDEKVAPELVEALQAASDFSEIEQAAACVSREIGGSWSIDFLRASNGDWFCIDMAIAGASYHWSGCPNEKRWS